MAGEIQYVFQDSLGAFDPRQRALAALEEILRLKGEKSSAERRSRAVAMMAEVGLGPEHESRRPHELSGGQRLNIARALLSDPEVLICDEPVSALDVSIQAQILNLHRREQRERKLSMLFISHDLPVVRHMCDTIGVMLRGRLADDLKAEDLFGGARHPSLHPGAFAIDALRGRKASLGGQPLHMRLSASPYEPRSPLRTPLAAAMDSSSAMGANARELLARRRESFSRGIWRVKGDRLGA